ncbi:MAG: hypothetical protein ACYS15_12410 [Planctomycetota bacterium]|jgi:hypothetical protein
MVDRRLGLEAAEARVKPSPGLRRRTLAALREATLQPDPAPARRRQIVLAYAAVCALVALVAVTAASHLAALGRQSAAPATSARGAGPLKLLRLDTVRLEAAVEEQLQLQTESWETPLMEEARLIAADARQAGEYLLARLPRAPGG